MDAYNLTLGDKVYPCRLSYKAQKALKYNTEEIPHFDGIDLLPWLYEVSNRANYESIPLNQEEVVAILFYAAWACNKDLSYDEFEDDIDKYMATMDLFNLLEPILNTSGLVNPDDNKKGKRSSSKN